MSHRMPPALSRSELWKRRRFCRTQYPLLTGHPSLASRAGRGRSYRHDALNRSERVAQFGTAPRRDVAVLDWIPRRSGRPSLSTPGTISPRVSFRLTAEVRDQAARIAKRQDKSLSRFAREALERRVEDCLLAEAARIARLRATLRQRGPGILDQPDGAYVEDVDDGWRPHGSTVSSRKDRCIVTSQRPEFSGPESKTCSHPLYESVPSLPHSKRN